MDWQMWSSDVACDVLIPRGQKSKSTSQATSLEQPLTINKLKVSQIIINTINIYIELNLQKLLYN